MITSDKWTGKPKASKVIYSVLNDIRCSIIKEQTVNKNALQAYRPSINDHTHNSIFCYCFNSLEL